MTSIVGKIRIIQKNLKDLIEVANVCHLAYCSLVKQEYKPFDESKPEEVAQNLAALQAVVSSIGLICELDNIRFRDDNTKEQDREVFAVIAHIIDGYERQITDRFSNCAWGAGQPYRTDNGPLGRATRMNVFDELPNEEVEKDFEPLRAVALWLLNKISAME